MQPMEPRADRRLAAELRAALALDDSELSFLREAALPARLAALIQQQANPRAQLLGLLWLVVPAAIGYAAWLVVAPLFSGGVTLAAQTGGSTLLASLFFDVGWGTLDTLAGLIEAASAVPGFNAPLVTLSVVAAALYATAVLLPSRRVRQRTSAV